jgi:predicted nuclease of predicted toxin-antitoxin system
VKVLFDHNVPRKLRRILQEHEVRTAVELGWAELENGELLRAAEDDGFAVMVTGDQNLSYQQNLEGRLLALVVLSTNNWNIVKVNPEIVAAAVRAATPGSFQTVSF